MAKAERKWLVMPVRQGQVFVPVDQIVAVYNNTERGSVMLHLTGGQSFESFGVAPETIVARLGMTLVPEEE